MRTIFIITLAAAAAVVAATDGTKHDIVFSAAKVCIKEDFQQVQSDMRECMSSGVCSDNLKGKAECMTKEMGMMVNGKLAVPANMELPADVKPCVETCMGKGNLETTQPAVAQTYFLCIIQSECAKNIREQYMNKNKNQ